MSVYLRCFVLHPILLGCFLLSMQLGCREKKNEIRHGSSQQANAREQKQQNQNLISQVVIAAEELERHPDPAFLRNALTRLNSWLDKKAEVPGFVADPELATLSAKHEELSELLSGSVTLIAKFLADSSTSNVTEQEGEQLLASFDKISQLCHDLEQTIPSQLYPILGKIAEEFAGKLQKSKEYQFGNRVEMFRSVVSQFQVPPWCQLSHLADVFREFADLLKTQGRSFQRSDSDWIKQSVWLRNIANWAKGKKQDDLEIACHLFDWTIKNVILSGVREQGPLGAIPQSPWETILLSHGTSMERALVFMELLRQVRLDSFIIEPLQDKPVDFPLLVGVRISEKVYLFLPELGLPFPGKGEFRLLPELTYPVATLQEVCADETLIRQLDISETEKFPLQAAQLQETVARIPTTPYSLSERMIIIEQEFSGNIYTVLATSLTDQKDRLAALKLFKEVNSLWSEYVPLLERILFPEESNSLLVPYLFTIQEGGNLNVSVQSSKFEQDQEQQNSKDKKKSPLRDAAAMNCPLWVGKILYFKGKFTDEEGAAHALQQGRISDRVLKQSVSEIEEKTNELMNHLVQENSKLPSPLSQEDMQNIGREFFLVEQQKIALKRYVKLAARFYLALVTLATDNNETALMHLNDTSLLNEMQSYWKLGTLYLIGRIDESMGKWDSAAGIYANFSGPEGYGNRLRGKWLSQLTQLSKNGESRQDNLPSAEPTIENVKKTVEKSPEEKKIDVKKDDEG